MQEEARVLWNLVLTARFDITRAVALARLSKIDPEKFEKVRDIVNREHPPEASPEDVEFEPRG